MQSLNLRALPIEVILRGSFGNLRLAFPLSRLASARRRGRTPEARGVRHRMFWNGDFVFRILQPPSLLAGERGG